MDVLVSPSPALAECPAARCLLWRSVLQPKNSPHRDSAEIKALQPFTVDSENMTILDKVADFPNYWSGGWWEGGGGGYSNLILSGVSVCFLQGAKLKYNHSKTWCMRLNTQRDFGEKWISYIKERVWKEKGKKTELRKWATEAAMCAGAAVKSAWSNRFCLSGTTTSESNWKSGGDLEKAVIQRGREGGREGGKWAKKKKN